MKSIMLSFAGMIFFHADMNAQTVKEFQAAISQNDKTVQAIHHYPNNIKNGQCHNVEVILIKVVDGNITIEEHWSNWLGSKAKTILTGVLTNSVARGKWKSDYSSGTWSYDFSNQSGQWNKTSSGSFDKFENLEVLEFKIVDKKQIKDGFFNCK